MKKLLVILLALLSMLTMVVGCGEEKKPVESVAKKAVLKIGATAVPHAEILNCIKDDLAREGVEIDIIEFSDYMKPNLALMDKELDANFFQHGPYLEAFGDMLRDQAPANFLMRGIGFDTFDSGGRQPLVSAGKVHIEPMGIYSLHIKSIKEVPDGAKVTIPNDPSNCSRALTLLEEAGLLKLKMGVGVRATVGDIVENNKQLEIVEIEAAMLPRSLNDTDLSVINSNFAMEANLNPAQDAIYSEFKDSPYANVVAVRIGDNNRPEIKKLMAALRSDRVRKFIDERYKGAVVPAF